jgi:hypothetical protein
MPEGCQRLNRLHLSFGRSEQWFNGYGHFVFPQINCRINYNGAVQHFDYRNIMLQRNTFSNQPMVCHVFVASAQMLPQRQYACTSA